MKLHLWWGLYFYILFLKSFATVLTASPEISLGNSLSHIFGGDASRTTVNKRSVGCSWKVNILGASDKELALCGGGGEHGGSELWQIKNTELHFGRAYNRFVTSLSFLGPNRMWVSGVFSSSDHPQKLSLCCLVLAPRGQRPGCRQRA